MQKKRSVMGAVVAGLTGLFLLASAPYASAHDRSVDLSCGIWGYCGWGSVLNNHTTVRACDSVADGYGVRTHYWLKSGASGLVGDANGSESGCGIRDVGTTSNPVVSFQVCAGKNGIDTWCTSKYSS